MPIYAYRCEACGFKKDVLQKLSDAPLRECPTCGKQTFSKALSAPAFQLKGSGWYVTDFRDNSKGQKNGEPAAADVSKSDSPPAASTSTASTDGGGSSAASTATAPAPSAPSA